MHGHRDPNEEEHTVSDASMDPGDIAAELARLGSATIGESGGLAAHRRLRPAWSGAARGRPGLPRRLHTGRQPGRARGGDHGTAGERPRRRRRARWPTAATGARC